MIGSKGLFESNTFLQRQVESAIHYGKELLSFGRTFISLKTMSCKLHLYRFVTSREFLVSQSELTTISDDLESLTYANVYIIFYS